MWYIHTSWKTCRIWTGLWLCLLLSWFILCIVCVRKQIKDMMKHATAPVWHMWLDAVTIQTEKLLSCLFSLYAFLLWWYNGTNSSVNLDPHECKKSWQYFKPTHKQPEKLHSFTSKINLTTLFWVFNNQVTPHHKSPVN